MSNNDDGKKVTIYYFIFWELRDFSKKNKIDIPRFEIVFEKMNLEDFVFVTNLNWCEGDIKKKSEKIHSKYRKIADFRFEFGPRVDHP